MDLDTLQELFRRIGSGADSPIQVLIELLLIGLCVNWCAGVLHGTRGTRLLRGLLVVLIVVTLLVRVIAAQLGWERLELLYRYFITGLAFIALVAFQPELRRALIRAGDVSFLRRDRPRDKLIAALIEASGYLSRNRFGAIVAIQRDVGLNNWVEHGTQINADVSADLLKSIFYPNSPLHDLGVIVRGPRLLAAGCQFPVAESGEVEPSLGSRHRAAVGLSSETDSLVLVISEETGTISLADRGQLTRYLSLDDLEEELNTRLTSPYPVHARGGSRTLSDLWRFLRRMLVIVPLTLVIWFMADQASLIRADDIRARLDVKQTPDRDVEMIEPDNGVFTLSVRGPTRTIELLRAKSAAGYVGLPWSLESFRTPGPHVLSGDALRDFLGDLAPLEGLIVERALPSDLRFQVHEVIEIALPVEVDPGNLRVTDVVVEPPQVTVGLRRGDLEQIPADQRRIVVRVDQRLAEAPRGRETTVTARIEPSLAGAPLLSVAPDAVQVRARVVARREKRRLTGVPVRILKSPTIEERFRVEPVDEVGLGWLIDIEVEADSAVAERLLPSDVRAFVEFTGDPVSTGLRTEPVRIQLPEGVTLVSPPPLLRVRVEPWNESAP